MNRWGRAKIEASDAEQVEDFSGERVGVEDAELTKALSDFRASIHAWSDAAYASPRPAMSKAAVRTGRQAAVWAMGCFLAVSAAGGGIYEHHHRQELARIAAERDAQKKAAAERAKETEDLLARVDSDVSREVPDAMEPLAQLMDEDSSQ